MPDLPNAELLPSLGRLVRGLSALFWGLPFALVACVQTAKGDWLRPFGVVPAVTATGLLLYGVHLLGRFQKQERIWRASWERARLLALLNLGLAPFLFWWSRIPGNPFYAAMVNCIFVSGLLFIYTLNPLLRRLSAMLPDETLRHETALFTRLNQKLILGTCALGLLVWSLEKIQSLPRVLIAIAVTLDQMALWIGLFFILLSVAMTMALLWKTKEVILESVFRLPD